MNNELEGLWKKYLVAICPDELRKILTNLSKDSRSCNQDMNPGPPE
jgi:hypothetical protein